MVSRPSPLPTWNFMEEPSESDDNESSEPVIARPSKSTKRASLNDKGKGKNTSESKKRHADAGSSEPRQKKQKLDANGASSSSTRPSNPFSTAAGSSSRHPPIRGGRMKSIPASQPFYRAHPHHEQGNLSTTSNAREPTRPDSVADVISLDSDPDSIPDARRSDKSKGKQRATHTRPTSVNVSDAPIRGAPKPKPISRISTISSSKPRITTKSIARTRAEKDRRRSLGSPETEDEVDIESTGENNQRNVSRTEREGQSVSRVQTSNAARRHTTASISASIPDVIEIPSDDEDDDRPPPPPPSKPKTRKSLPAQMDVIVISDDDEPAPAPVKKNSGPRWDDLVVPKKNGTASNASQPTPAVQHPSDTDPPSDPSNHATMEETVDDLLLSSPFPQRPPSLPSLPEIPKDEPISPAKPSVSDRAEVNAQDSYELSAVVPSPPPSPLPMLSEDAAPVFSRNETPPITQPATQPAFSEQNERELMEPTAEAMARSPSVPPSGRPSNENAVEQTPVIHRPSIETGPAATESSSMVQYQTVLSSPDQHKSKRREMRTKRKNENLAKWAQSGSLTSDQSTSRESEASASTTASKRASPSPTLTPRRRFAARKHVGGRPPVSPDPLTTSFEASMLKAIDDVRKGNDDEEMASSSTTVPRPRRPSLPKRPLINPAAQAAKERGEDGEKPHAETDDKVSQIASVWASTAEAISDVTEEERIHHVQSWYDYGQLENTPTPVPEKNQNHDPPPVPETEVVDLTLSDDESEDGVIIGELLQLLERPETDDEDQGNSGHSEEVRPNSPQRNDVAESEAAVLNVQEEDDPMESYNDIASDSPPTPSDHLSQAFSQSLNMSIEEPNTEVDATNRQQQRSPSPWLEYISDEEQEELQPDAGELLQPSNVVDDGLQASGIQSDAHPNDPVEEREVETTYIPSTEASSASNSPTTSDFEQLQSPEAKSLSKPALRRSNRSSRTASRRISRSSTSSDELNLIVPEDSPEPNATPTPVSYDGITVLTWKTFKMDLSNFVPKCYWARDLPHDFQDHINWLPPETRDYPQMKAVFEAVIAENTPEDFRAPPIVLQNTVDDHPTPPWEFYYTNRMWHSDNVPAPTVKGLESCDCVGSCNEKKCPCVKRQQSIAGKFHEGFIYTEDGRVKIGGCPVVECNSMCGCDDNCRNRVVQHGRTVDVTIFKTKWKGWGVRANKKIAEGAFIGIYSGELLTTTEAEERGVYYDKVGRTYLFDIDFWYLEEQNTLEMEEYTVDAYHAGNFTRFLNHSCDPNARFSPVYIDEANVFKPLLVVFARRDIERNEEITFSYLGDPDNGSDNEEEPSQNESPNKKSPSKKRKAKAGNLGNRNYMECKCGAKNCTGYMFN